MKTRATNSAPPNGGCSGQRACPHAHWVYRRRLTGRLRNTTSCLTCSSTHSLPSGGGGAQALKSAQVRWGGAISPKVLAALERVLEEGSLKTAKKLQAQQAVLQKGLQMNQVCERVFPRRDEDGFDR